MSISLRQLRIFEATARLGRLTTAANEQAMSQSAASQALKELEVTLEYPLFNRCGRLLELTPAGIDILPRVRNILDLTDGLKIPRNKGVSGSLHVAASVTIASYLLPKLLADFIDLYPGVEPDLQITNTKDVITRMEKGKAYVGLIEGPAVHDQLLISPWLEDHLEIFCKPDHPLAVTRVLTTEQIRNQRWVLRELGSGTRAVFDLGIQRSKAQVMSILALNRQEAIKQAVKAGLGIGCLSHLSVAEEVKSGELVLLRTPLNLKRRFSLVTQSPEKNNRLVQTFIEFLTQQGQQ